MPLVLLILVALLVDDRNDLSCRIDLRKYIKHSFSGTFTSTIVYFVSLHLKWMSSWASTLCLGFITSSWMYNTSSVTSRALEYTLFGFQVLDRLWKSQLNWLIIRFQLKNNIRILKNMNSVNYLLMFIESSCRWANRRWFFFNFIIFIVMMQRFDVVIIDVIRFEVISR